MHLWLHAMPIDNDKVLSVMHAEPGSCDEEALSRLGSLIRET